jgi:hypothetical protein
MEMRRLGNATPGERFAVWLYWIVSGYGLRPLRALIALVALLGISSWSMRHFGIVGTTSYTEAFLASLSSAVNLEYMKSEAFTLAGQWIRITLRVLGPVLFAAILLAFWGRVKR